MWPTTACAGGQRCRNTSHDDRTSTLRCRCNYSNCRASVAAVLAVAAAADAAISETTVGVSDASTSTRMKFSGVQLVQSAAVRDMTTEPLDRTVISGHPKRD